MSRCQGSSRAESVTLETKKMLTKNTREVFVTIYMVGAGVVRTVPYPYFPLRGALAGRRRQPLVSRATIRCEQGGNPLCASNCGQSMGRASCQRIRLHFIALEQEIRTRKAAVPQDNTQPPPSRRSSPRALESAGRLRVVGI